MAEMASWFHVNKGKPDEGFIFLTDEDIIAWYDQRGEGRNAIDWNNMVGHYGIIHVFKTDHREHLEGFVNMPDVIRKTILDGKMDMMFAHAGNLREATPEFIPMMTRLANRFEKVEAQLKCNPYRNYRGQTFTLRDQMKIGVENGFTGSTIGEILRSDLCNEETMLIALKGAVKFMDEYTDHHHYHQIINNNNVTRKVLKYMLEHVPHTDVIEAVKLRLKTVKAKAMMQKAKSIKRLQVQVTKMGDAKVRVAV
jgi:hypothetical protein